MLKITEPVQIHKKKCLISPLLSFCYTFCALQAQSCDCGPVALCVFAVLLYTESQPSSQVSSISIDDQALRSSMQSLLHGPSPLLGGSCALRASP